MPCAKTAVITSSAATVRYASNAAAARETTAKSAACVKCAWSMSVPVEMVVRSAHMSAPTAVKNVPPAPRRSCVSNAALASNALAARAISAPRADIAKTAWSRSATAVMAARNARSSA